MQHKSFFSPASLALILTSSRKRRRQLLVSSSASKNSRATVRAARAATSLFEQFTYFLHIFFSHWILQIVDQICRLFFGNCQLQKYGVMGGHSRRSKQSAKSSSTVLCDSAVTLQGWKQQIKVKDCIPVNQQRLTFSSQRSIKQHFALAKLNPKRQWQIVVDATLEEVCEDLRHWRATLQSSSTAGELLQPLVIKETDIQASFLHSKTADELRELGVPCSVFFLSFHKWVPTLQCESSKELKDLDIKIDEEFKKTLFFIELHGDLRQCPIPIPLKYVMNGTELASKLLAVKQTKQKYWKSISRRVQETNAESSEASIMEAHSQNACPSNYILEIDQDNEYTTLVSRDNRLESIVIPLITIPLIDRKGSEDVISLGIPSSEIDRSGVSVSSRLALPPALEIGEPSAIVGSNVEDVLPSNNLDNSTQKALKKKRKKKTKKASKENAKSCAQSARNTQGEIKNSSSDASMSHLRREVSETASNHKNPESTTEKNVRNEVKHKPYNKAKHSTTLLAEDLRDCTLNDIKSVSDSSNPRKFSKCLDHDQTYYSALEKSNFISDSAPMDEQTHMKQDEREHTLNKDNFSMVTKEEEGLVLGTGRSDECINVGGFLIQKEPLSGYNLDTYTGNYPDSYGTYDQSLIISVDSASVYGSDCHSIPNSLSVKKGKESGYSKFQPGAAKEIIPNYQANISNQQTGRNFTHSHIRCINTPWTCQAAEGQGSVTHRPWFNSNPYTSCDPRSSIPFWRHQMVNLPMSSYLWSKVRLSREDDWTSNRKCPSPFRHRQSRNIQNWEQLPNPQPLNGNTYPMHWESHTPPDRQWAFPLRGPNYSSFNMKQRKTDKNIRAPQKYFNKWHSNVADGQITPHARSLTATSSSSGLDEAMQSRSVSILQTFSKELDMNSGNKIVQGLTKKYHNHKEAAPESESTVHTTSKSMNSLQVEQQSSAQGVSDLLVLKSLVAKHVCEILGAVNTSYESWSAYKEITKLNKKALCEFECVARAVTPTFKAFMRQQIWEPNGCLCDTLLARSKFSRQVTDVQLGTLWQWYEEPSSYGLKVKLSESSERTGRNFQAFFVPYLSAIQLFGWSKKKMIVQDKDMMTKQKFEKEAATFQNQYRLPFHVPGNDILDNLYTIEDSAKHNGANHILCDTRVEEDTNSDTGGQCHCDVELLYEFFEVEKPQQRKPLVERVEELVSSTQLTNGASCNTEMLMSASIGELHPSSWFAVAWYPIYKIPDESFQAAFLTYHCLGRLESVCKRFSNMSHHVENSVNTVAVPVVGLKSYNARAKDWFAVSNLCDMSSDNALHEYLSNLEIAATAMARGSCDKSSGFKHADFSFFQSRGR
ncbi:hypothetical protein KP509_1Z014900 [Ceratopteris richardii]|nr:hypothetical protein KP509_1Z014900 [Ceratopteris richardii]